MPNCFALYRKTTGEKAVLQQVDDEMRQHFGAEPDPTNWYCYWYETVGFSLAMGKTFDWCRANNPVRLEIIDWLDANFTVDCWAEVGRR